jgi:predicted phage terminase large subunit-like protein
VTFALTAKQVEAQAILASPAKHLMLFGGSRSGKTFLLVRNVVMRALKAANSRHAIFRFRFNSVKNAVVLDTFPKVMRLAFPEVTYKLDKTDWYAKLPNKSEIWFAGLDDKERAEKVLGMEFATIYFNECSQIPLNSINLAITRLAQSVDQQIDDRVKPLKPRVYYDENPPSKAHWSYKKFIKKADPETGEELKKPDDYAWFKINPQDNRENVAEDYIETLEGMGARHRKRFLEGDFADEAPGALFSDETIEKWRHDEDQPLPEMVRVVVAVDPSGSDDDDNADNDEIGIVVAGLGQDGNAYLVEDCTVKAGPATWGNIATTAFDRHKADAVVGEINYGGAMVRHVIQTARPRTPFRQVHASRGKAVRAEPFSALYEQGKIRHAGRFPALESELTAFTTHGYVGGDSPNRADALIWALSDLFPGMVQPKAANDAPVSIPSLSSAFNR